MTTTRHAMTRAAISCAAGTMIVVLMDVSPALPQGTATPLPSVTVDAPQQARRATSASRGRSSSSTLRRIVRARQPSNQLPQATRAATAARETAWGHVDGIVATRSGTGTKTDTPLIETPQSISVVTQDQIQAQAFQSAGQAVRYLPGVRSEVTGADARFDAVYIRGFLGDQYLDGLRLLNFGIYNYTIVEPFNLERIEVLRGPASILYGQASPGGIVNMVSKRPSFEPYHEMFVSTGTRGRIQSGVDLSGPLDSNKELAYRLTASGFDVGSQVDYQGYQRVSIAPSLTWRPTNDTTLTVLGTYQRDPKAGFYNQISPYGIGTIFPYKGQTIPTSFFSGEPGFDHTSRSYGSIGYLLEHNVGAGLTLRQNLRYMDSDTDVAVTSPNFSTDPTKLTRGAYTTQEYIKSFSVDTQAEGRFRIGSFEHTTLFGIDYRNASDKAYNGTGTATTINAFAPVYGTIPVVNPVSANGQNVQQLGVYAQDQIKFDNWVALLGIRRDQADSQTKNLFTGIQTSDKSDAAITKRGALLYKFDNGVSPYVQYTESFQPTVGTDFFGNSFVPTRGQQYEGGIKYQPNPKALYTLAYFDLTQQNVLTSDPDPTHVGKNVQTGEIRSRGVEVEAKAEVNANLTALASYTYLDLTVTKSNNAAQLGKRPIGMPTHSASAWADYTFHSGPLDGFGVAGGVRYIGESAGTISNYLPNSTTPFNVPAVTLVDAAIHYDLSALGKQFTGMKLSVNATNLFDKVYVGICQDFGCYYGLRREVIATLRYRW
ncbi:TonB-dependent receptor [Rhodopseudomonas sp. AAP120]|nr:TonB-dependent receptor [Rhodopseudomonas sp. AAP120]